MCGGGGVGGGKRFSNQLLTRVFCDEINNHNCHSQGTYMYIRISSWAFARNHILYQIINFYFFR